MFATVIVPEVNPVLWDQIVNSDTPRIWMVPDYPIVDVDISGIDFNGPELRTLIEKWVREVQNVIPSTVRQYRVWDKRNHLYTQIAHF